MITRFAKIDRNDKLIVIGQISCGFGLLILTLRHLLVYPAQHYPWLVVLLLIGFLPSFSHKLLPLRWVHYILIANALLIVSFVFVLMQEWALAGVFVLLPVYSLLFANTRIYLFSSICALILNVTLSLLFLYRPHPSPTNLVILLDVLTVFLILAFIIFFVTQELRLRSMAEARHMQTIQALSQSVDAKDPYTQGHSERVAYLGRLIASRLPGVNASNVYSCGLIHDVGKLSIPDYILLKTGRLANEEYNVMKTHTTIGAKLCTNLQLSAELVLGVRHHHERWDGRGYPDGLAGEAIPLIGRVLGVADAIDAMCSNRAYRKAMDIQAVLEEVRRCGGSQFDPALVRIVLDRQEEIRAYYLSERHMLDQVASVDKLSV